MHKKNIRHLLIHVNISMVMEMAVALSGAETLLLTLQHEFPHEARW